METKNLSLGRKGADRFWRRGEPLVWATAAALAAVLLFIAGFLAIIAWGGLRAFWPTAIVQLTLADGRSLFGRITAQETNPDTGEESLQIKVANREQDPLRQDFRWLPKSEISHFAYPEKVLVLERVENGDWYGCLHRLSGPHIEASQRQPTLQDLAAAMARVRREKAAHIDPLDAEIFSLGGELQKVGEKLLKVRYRISRATGAEAERLAAWADELETRSRHLKDRSDELGKLRRQKLAELRRNVAVMGDAMGKETQIALLDVVRAYQPNVMSTPAKLLHYLRKLLELLWENPRESNTEGGLFPAIFGTVMMVFLMAVSCFPLGVLAGIYLGEYAREGMLRQLVRIAVNNMAGIPSIVYGVFGLGFFVYGVGGKLDLWFYPERAATGTPVFGTGGILWASLTMGLLTMPVVIVACEEALRTIPRAFGECSQALGATKFQTLVRVKLPVAAPGILTGFILAMARAAGEVAPLMLTGVVKLAPQLPLDGDFPFFHLERKFMHLGFHIYDVGFQSPNVEACKPMVYLTALLLLTVVLLLNGLAMNLRGRLRKRYRVSMF